VVSLFCYLFLGRAMTDKGLSIVAAYAILHKKENEPNTVKK
jgi:hypothetical protein